MKNYHPYKVDLSGYDVTFEDNFICSGVGDPLEARWCLTKQANECTCKAIKVAVLTPKPKKEENGLEYKPEGWEKHWELVNSQIKDGVNPSAYRLGFLDAIKSKPSVTEESQEELWKSFHDDYIKLEHAHQWVDLKNKFTITRKPKTT